MNARQIDVATFCARMGDEDRRAVRQALAAGMGMARYGINTVSYGTREPISLARPPALFMETRSATS